jgi:N-acetylmuramoyl-L-alanine amidase
MKKYIFFFLIALLTFTILSIYNNNCNIPIETLSKSGSTGEEVKQIQIRLKEWGYYNGSVDGIYGSRTVNAVKLFQKKNGLRIDGIAGPETLTALGLPAGSTNKYKSGDIDLIARAINGESRGEPYIGQVAVGAVIMNRVKHPSFPNTIAGVIYQPGAFTAITDGQIHAQIVSTSVKAAKDAMNGWDPSGGAIYYYNPAKTTNKWIYSRPVVTKIGSHVFAK